MRFLSMKKLELTGVFVCAGLIALLQCLPDGSQYYKNPIQLPPDIQQMLDQGSVDEHHLPQPPKNPDRLEGFLNDATFLLRVIKSIVLYFIFNADPIQLAYQAGFWHGRIRGFLEGILVCIGLILLIRIVQDRS